MGRALTDEANWLLLRNERDDGKLAVSLLAVGERFKDHMAEVEG